MRLVHSTSLLETTAAAPVRAGGGGSRAELARAVGLLPERDRAIVELSLVQGLSSRKVGERLGMHAGAVCRRARRLRNLFASPVVRAIAADVHALPETVRQLTIDYYFARTPIGTLAERYDLTTRAVRSHLDYVRGWARTVLHMDVRTGSTDPDDDDDGDEADPPDPPAARSARSQHEI